MVLTHLLGNEVIEKNGLFGTILIDHDILRWLAIPEVCCLLGIVHPWECSLDIREVYKILGNAISVPHALLALTNALGQLQVVPWVGTPIDVIERAFATFLTARKQEIQIDTGNNMMRISRFQVSPTLPWEVSTRTPVMWLFPYGPISQKVFAYPGLPLASVIRAWFPSANGGSITWRPNEFPHVQIPLTAEDLSGFALMRFDGNCGFLHVREADCVCRRKPFVLIFLPDQIVVLPKNGHSTIQEVRCHLETRIRTNDLAADFWGIPMSQNVLCPDALTFGKPPKRYSANQLLGWHHMGRRIWGLELRSFI